MQAPGEKLPGESKRGVFHSKKLIVHKNFISKPLDFLYESGYYMFSTQENGVLN